MFDRWNWHLACDFSKKVFCWSQYRWWVENVIKYISGFIAIKILNIKTFCPTCAEMLRETEPNKAPFLIETKNLRPLIFPSKDFMKIRLLAKWIFRQNYHNLFKKENIKNVLEAPFSNREMQKHVLSQDVINNHRIQLIKEMYLNIWNIRLYHEAKERSEKDEHIR